MLLNSRQAGEKLGVSSNTVLTMMRKGLLTDKGITEPGKVKHVMLFESAEVNALAREYRERKGSTVRDFEPNGVVASPSPVPTPVVAAVEDRPAPAPSNIVARLDRIEALLNKLVACWT